MSLWWDASKWQAQFGHIELESCRVAVWRYPWDRKICESEAQMRNVDWKKRSWSHAGDHWSHRREWGPPRKGWEIIGEKKQGEPWRQAQAFQLWEGCSPFCKLISWCLVYRSSVSSLPPWVWQPWVPWHLGPTTGRMYPAWWWPFSLFPAIPIGGLLASLNICFLPLTATEEPVASPSTTC